MTFDFDKVIDRTNTASEKWDRYRGRDIIPMWVADMDFACPPRVIEALNRRLSHPVLGYTGPSKGLAEAAVSWCRSHYDWNVDPTWLVWLPGLVTGFNVACRVVGETGDEILSPTPVYPHFLKAPGNFGKKLKTVPLELINGRWTYDPDRFEAAVGSGVKLFLFCHPHNPAGTVFRRDELRHLSEICVEHDVVICSDDIHCDLIVDEGVRHIPVAALDPKIARHTITLMAPSKTFNIPGLGCSFAVIPDEKLRRTFKTGMAGIVPGVNTMGFEAGLAALRDGEAWRLALIDYLRRNRDLVYDRINRMNGLTMAKPAATFLAWIDARKLPVENPAFFFENAGVGFSDGTDFGAPGFIRLNFGCPRIVLKKGLDRMEKAVSG